MYCTLPEFEGSSRGVAVNTSAQAALLMAPIQIADTKVDFLIVHE